MDKPTILVIGGEKKDREALIDELYEKLEIGSKVPTPCRLRYTDDPWDTLKLRHIGG